MTPFVKATAGFIVLPVLVTWSVSTPVTIVFFCFALPFAHASRQKDEGGSKKP
jgi:hypothetical protein